MKSKSQQRREAVQKKGERVAAQVVIFDAPKMSDRGRKDINNWLRRVGRTLMSQSKKLDKKFTAKYFY